MFIKEIKGYLSKYKGTEVDSAVEKTQLIDAELALKVDKTTKVNGFPLSSSITLTAEDVGALSESVPYGASVSWDNENETLSLLDQDGNILNSQNIKTSTEWGEISGTLADQTDLKTALDSKQGTISALAMISSDFVDDTNKAHKFATATQLTQIGTNKSDIAAINSLIPAQTTSSNQLADKQFVNSTVSTNTATFIGTFSSMAELESYSGTLTNNDYAFVTSTDTEGNTVYNRYKYTTATTPSSWVFEYALNNSSFTAVQWDAINSGISETGVSQIAVNTNSISTINETLTNFGDIVNSNIADFATAAQGNLADTALQPSDVDTSISSSSTNPVQNKVISTALNGKQATITGAASSIALNDLTSSRVVVSNSSGKIDTSSITTTKLGYLSNVTSDIQTQLNSKTTMTDVENKGYITGITSSDVTTALGFTPYDSSNPSGYITGITSSDVTTALGFTPYDSSNPDGFISSASISSLTDVNLVGLSDGECLIYDSDDDVWKNQIINAVTSLDALTDVTILNPSTGQNLTYDATTGKWKNTSTSATVAWGGITGTLSDQTDLKAALDGKQATITGAITSVVSNDLTSSRVVISDSSGKVAASSITTTKLGYLSNVTSDIQTQINAKTTMTDVENKGYITGISSSDVTTALGFTPYSNSNPDGFISSASISSLTDVSLANLANGENLVYDSTIGKWKNSASTATVAWGGITGTLSDQTDLKNALDGKQNALSYTPCQKFSVTNPALTAVDGEATWTLSNSIGSKKVDVQIYEVSSYNKILASTFTSDASIEIKLISSSDIAAGTYEAVIIG